MEEQKQGCTGDCRTCTIIQRGYCASQIAYNNIKAINTLYEEMNKLEAVVERIEGKLRSEELKEPNKAQEESGAENRLSEQ